MDYTVRDARIKQLGFADYTEYLRSDQWKRTRAAFLAHVTEICSGCHIPAWLCKLAYGKGFNVHHTNYDHLGEEKLEDLEILCWRCHELQHFGKSDLPKILMHPCVYCGRPRIIFDPPVNIHVKADDEMSSAAEIISNAGGAFQFLMPKRVAVQLQPSAKLLEVMKHPSCSVQEQLKELKKRGRKMNTHQMKIYFSLLGEHAHLRVFTGKLDGTMGLAGTLVMSISEFDAWRAGNLELVFEPEAIQK
jgi:hypothetical protein